MEKDPQLQLEGVDVMPKDLGVLTLKFARQADSISQPEIFDTVQGEGRNLGSPVTFARLSGCNLQCTWCDTPYTWNWEGTDFFHDEGKKYVRELEQVVISVGDAVDQITQSPLKRLVITGGEPLQQQRNLAPMLGELRRREPDYWVEIETNGTIEPSTGLISTVDQFNVSPKLANSGNELSRRRKDKAMETFAKLDNADFKFVVFGDDDLPEIIEMVERYEIPHERVFLMPEGRTEEEVKRHQIELVELCKAQNFNLTTRLHVLIWGAKRGV